VKELDSVAMRKKERVMAREKGLVIFKWHVLFVVSEYSCAREATYSIKRVVYGAYSKAASWS
jgi:hypothetical protein